MFDMITGKNESNILKDVSWKCKCKFDGRKCNSNQKWNNDKLDTSVKNIYVKKIILGILLHVGAKMVNIQQALLTIH